MAAAIENLLVEKSTSVGPYYRRYPILWALCLCNMSDVVEMVSIGFILASMPGLSNLDKSIAAASIYFGIMVGELVWGPLADVLGRKALLQSCLLISGFSAFASAFSPSISLLIICRVFAGFGIGGVVPTVYSLGTELFSVERRGAIIATICSMKEIASIFASVLAWIILGNDLQDNRIAPSLDWRVYAMVCAVPAFLAFILSLFLVESPLFLIDRREFEQAAASLSYLSDKPVTAEEVELSVQIGKPRSKVIFPLLRYPSLSPLLLLTGIFFCMFFTNYGLINWITTLFIELGYTNPYADSCIIYLAALPGLLLSVFIIERVGRINLLTISLFCTSCALCGFAMNLSNAPIVFICVSGYGFFNAMAVNAMLVIAADNYFPTYLRSSALAFITLVARSGAIAAQFVFGNLQSNIVILLLITAGLTFFSCVLSLCLPAKYDYNGEPITFASSPIMPSQKDAELGVNKATPEVAKPQAQKDRNSSSFVLEY